MWILKSAKAPYMVGENVAEIIKVWRLQLIRELLKKILMLLSVSIPQPQKNGYLALLLNPIAVIEQ